MSTTPDGPCLCWSGPPIIHDGHCCMRGIPDTYQTGDPIPCGHLHEGLTRWRAAQAARKDTP